MLNQRYEDEEYKGYAIRVYAERQDAQSSWTIQVQIQAPDGTHLPPIMDADNSYPIVEQAFTIGSELGRRIVDGG